MRRKHCTHTSYTLCNGDIAAHAVPVLGFETEIGLKLPALIESQHSLYCGIISIPTLR